jgi:hypothetical protein
MHKVLDVTARIICYNGTTPTENYYEKRGWVVLDEGSPETLSITDNDIAFCNLVSNQDFIVESLLNHTR